MRKLILVAALSAVIASISATVLVGGLILGAESARSAEKTVLEESVPPLGIGGGQAQGDVDCSSGVDAVDSLKVLRHNAALSVAQTEPCTDIGALLEVGGFQRVTAAFPDVGAGTEFMTVDCPVGKRVFGGGVRRTSGTLSGLSWAVMESYPNADQTSWDVLLYQADAGPRSYEVSAICAPASP